MTPSLQHLPFDTTALPPTGKSQEPFLHKLKSGFAKFVNRRRHSSIVDTFRPNKPHYSPARQDSFTSDRPSHEQQQQQQRDDEDEENDVDDDDNDDLDSSSITRVNSEYKLASTCYSKDDHFERTRYKATSSQHQHSRRPSVISIQSPPSILVNRSPTPSSNHRHTSSLQNASIISVPGSNGRPSHYHHSRHYSHISFMSASNMTVNSEDLTAKEFADMAGIKIIPDDDDDSNHHDDESNIDNDNDNTSNSQRYEDPTEYTTSSNMAKSITNRNHHHLHQSLHQATSSASSIVTPTRQHSQQQPSYFSYHAGDENNWSVGSTQSQQSGAAKIWDTEFWKRPLTDDPPALRKHRSALLQHRQTLSLPPPIPPSKVHGQHVKSKSTVDLPIVHELKRIHSNNVGDPQVIRKGRFEIQLESNS
ncbi:hypothetical protein [Absidia glauca]|uniref:Uncharacterized protein n=1 Tax=Absidia glauca TaxID=4829 RepID=A0A163JBS7_ABSGL|nr:hypothetical protein [Absidia glauca]